jgi:superfamily I DNA/RNA helicase
VDGNVDDRRGTVSVFNGQRPGIQICENENAEIQAVNDCLRELTAEGFAAGEIGIFVRSSAQIGRARAAACASSLPFQVLDEQMETITGNLTISTMHLAKGLEFRAVIVMACDDEVIPLQERIESVSDNADLEEIYDTERHLLYVACTRARDRLLVTAIDPASEFVDDLVEN